MSLLWNNNWNSDIINKEINNNTWNVLENKEKTWTWNNKTWNNKTQDNVILTWNNTEEKKEHKLNILTYDKIIDTKTQKIFILKYKKESWWLINFKNYNNLEIYSKELIYKLATKQNDFDLAIIPSEWFDNIENLLKNSFKINTNWFDISSIFDYNFYKYVKDNNIKAIPFAIDPIIGYSTESIDTYQDFNTWKDIILKSDRLSEKEWIKKMPIFLGYDENYISYLKNNNNLFPIFNYIYNYYIHKQSKEWIKLLKDFWTNIIYKTFDLNLYKKFIVKYKKYNFCKNNENLCFILLKDSNIVYDFLSNTNFYEKNKLNIYKAFKIKSTNIVKTTLPLWKSIDEYPARWYIIIINPKINKDNLLIFLKTYIKIWKKDELYFYKNLISPFNWIKINKENDFLSKYIWRFITAENFWVWLENKLSWKQINYLIWNINIDLLFK